MARTIEIVNITTAIKEKSPPSLCLRLDNDSFAVETRGPLGIKDD